MRWQQLEYIAKGVFLGLLLYVALQQPSGNQIQLLLLCLVGGLGGGLIGAVVGSIRQGYRIKDRPFAFFLFLILEHPVLTYGGILAGMAVAAYLIPRTVEETWLLSALLAGGVLLGVAFPVVRMVKNPSVRSVLGITLALAPVGAILAWQYQRDPNLLNSTQAGFTLLVALPFFYLLTFAGRAEESEVEIG